MTATATKTLQATLAPPTAHKERKLNDLLDTYRDGLRKAFEAGADTVSAVSDIVTPYHLPYQAKAALCNYVPQLHTTYDAKEIEDDHPVRLTNQAAEFDHSVERDHEFTWWVPRPGRRTNFWIPLCITPEQEDLWHDLRKEMHTTLKRLQERDAAEWRMDERFDHYQNALTDMVERASRRAVEYARQFEKPVLVMEDLTYIREELDYGAYMNRRLHAWAFARLQSRVEDKAREGGIPVEYIRPEYTSQICHACGHIGDRPAQGVFKCANEECHASEFQADINAAANIARRVDPWGESLPLKPADGDSPRDGSARDSTATRSEQRPSRQMTLGELGSEPTAGT